jgi:hypothetical protein
MQQVGNRSIHKGLRCYLARMNSAEPKASRFWRYIFRSCASESRQRWALQLSTSTTLATGCGGRRASTALLLFTSEAVCWAGRLSPSWGRAASGQMLAMQAGGVSWVHQDPVTKSQRATDGAGNLVSAGTIDLDPWGGETNRSANSAFQPHKYTTYERDANGGDDAMMRRYQSNWTRFSQPDPYDGSYSLTNPQSSTDTLMCRTIR